MCSEKGIQDWQMGMQLDGLDGYEFCQTSKDCVEEESGEGGNVKDSIPPYYKTWRLKEAVHA